MESQTCFLVFFALFLAFSSSAQGAVDVTKALSQDPELSTFSDLLTKTNLVDPINKLNSVTVLAFDNAAASAITGKPLDVVKKIMSNHIVLEYFDLQKLAQRVMETKTVQLPTMFQSSGEAQNNAGFLNYALVGEGEDSFGSGVKGSPLDAKLVKSVMTQPDTLSVLQISQPIIAPGIESPSGSSPQTSNANAPAPAAASSDAKSPAPASSDKAEAPSTSDAKTPAPASSDAKTPAPASSDAKTPAPSSDTKAPSTSETPASSPAADQATAPASSETPASSPEASDSAPAPAKSEDAKEGPSAAEGEGEPEEGAGHESSANSHAQVFGVGVATVLISSLIVL